MSPCPNDCRRESTDGRGCGRRSPQDRPDLADAHLVLAGLDLDNTRRDAARERIERVLKTNPSHLDARAPLGAIAYVRDDKATFDAETARVLAINPNFGEVYRVAGDLAARSIASTRPSR